MKPGPTRRLKFLRSSSLTFVAILFILSIAPSAQAQHDNECSTATVCDTHKASDEIIEAQYDDECGTATLRGPYGYFFSGSAVGKGPAAAVGLVTFDGLGGVAAKDTLNTNGVVVRRSGSGIYQVNSNCTGSVSITVDAGQFSFDLMVIPRSSGAEFSLIVTNTGAIQTGEAIRIGEEDCTVATLKGTYRQSGSSLGMGASVGFRISDGAGSYYGEDTQMVGGVLGHRMVAAIYTVNGDCSGTSTFTNGSHFDSVYVAGGSQKFDVRTDAGTISLGTFKKEARRRKDDEAPFVRLR